MQHSDNGLFETDQSSAPSVLGAEHTSFEDGDLAYVPSLPIGRDDDEATLELRETVDGDLALLVFSSQDELVEHCGHRQPWIGVPRASVDELRSRSGADVVVWDTALNTEQRKDS